jgi:hypothetical protein
MMKAASTAQPSQEVQVLLRCSNNQVFLDFWLEWAFARQGACGGAGCWTQQRAQQELLKLLHADVQRQPPMHCVVRRRQ